MLRNARRGASKINREQGFSPATSKIECMERWKLFSSEAPIAPLNQNSFIRRAIADGTTASFCKKCFATIAVARREIELSQAEQDHVCHPFVLAFWESMLAPSESSKPNHV